MPQPQLARLWSAMQRARLPQVLVAYGTVSFGVLQLVDILENRIGLPDWFFPVALGLVLVGVPIVVATALVQSTHAAAPDAADPPAPEEPTSPDRAAAAAEEAMVLPAPESAAAASPGAARRWLTWRRAILGGMAAFALLGFTVTGYMTMRVLGIGPVGTLIAAGVLRNREPILIADFATESRDSLLAGGVTDALRVDVAQSPSVTVVPPERVRRVLALMEKPRTVRLDADLAREVALRDGIKAVVTGSVRSVGAGYVLTAQLATPDSGAVLAAFREEASDAAGVLPAVDRLSKELRAKIGESLRSIRLNQPLERVTTPSLEALTKYSLAVRTMDVEDVPDKAQALLEQAIALDTTFAMAYRKLYVVLRNEGRDPARAFTLIREAYAHRDHLTDRERLLTEGIYYGDVLDDPERAIAAYQALLASYPDDGYALNNVAVCYSRLGDWHRSTEYSRRELAADSGMMYAYTNYIQDILNLGDTLAATRMATIFKRRYPRLEVPELHLALIAVAEHDYDRAEAHLRAGVQLQPSRAPQVAWQQALIAATRGEVVRAQALLHPLEAGAAEHAPARALDIATLRAQMVGLVLEQPAQGLAILDSALAAYPLSAAAPEDRPYLQVASTYALLGRAAQARQFQAEWDAAPIARELRETRDQRAQATLLVALTAAAERRPDEALARLRDLSIPECPICRPLLLGRTYDLAGRPDSAAYYYEQYLATPSWRRLDQDALVLGRTYERLAELYEASGDRQRAALYSARLLRLWAHADPALAPALAAARARLARLAGDRPVQQ